MLTKTKGIMIAIGLFGFIFTAYLVITENASSFDGSICRWLYSIRSEPLTFLMKAITYMGNWQTIVFISIVLLFFQMTRKKYGYFVAASALFVSLFNRAVKSYFERPRPPHEVFLIEQGGYSFTSGHAITSLVVYGLLIYLVNKYMDNRSAAKIIIALLCIPLIFIGISRVYLGVHYPTDVIGGWGLGLIVLMIVIIIEQRINGDRRKNPYTFH